MVFILGYLSAALMEYFLHKIYLHKPNHSHITLHHKIFRHNYEDPNYHVKDIVSKPSYVMASSLLSLVLSVVLYPFIHDSYLIFVSGMLYLIWVEYVHYLFHSPKGYFLEKLTLFKMIKEHHRVHHTLFNGNYGIGSTLYDHILRTKLK